MEAPMAVVTAELTKGGVSDKRGVTRGMPGYTYINLTADMADGSKLSLGELYAYRVKYKYIDLLRMHQIALADEAFNYRGCVWAHHVIDTNRGDTMPNAKTTEEWYTVSEAAAVLKLADETVRRMLRRGTIHGARVTRQWRVSRTELERIAKGERTNGTECVGADGTGDCRRSDEPEVREQRHAHRTGDRGIAWHVVRDGAGA